MLLLLKMRVMLPITKLVLGYLLRKSSVSGLLPDLGLWGYTVLDSNVFLYT